MPDDLDCASSSNKLIRQTVTLAGSTPVTINNQHTQQQHATAATHSMATAATHSTATAAAAAHG